MLVNRRVFSQRVYQIPPSGIRKYFDLSSGVSGIISLGVGEPDFVTPWHISEAAIKSIEKGYTMYTSNSGLFELRQEVSKHLQKTYGVSYDPNTEILITVGVSEALHIAMLATINPGDEVIVPDPTYVAYIPCILMAGGTAVQAPTDIDHSFKVCAADIEERITENTRAILIGYPNNPTGAIMEKADLEEVAKVAEKHDLIVVSDEIYDQLVYDVPHTCFSSLPGMRDRTILLGGFSKAYSMTGWRVGYMCAPAEVIEAVMKIHQYIIMCAPIMGQMAAIEALKYGGDAAQKMVEDYNQRRRIIVKGLNDIGLNCFEPKGAFYAFPSIKKTGLSSIEFCDKILEEEKVVVVPGSVFGECGEGYVRCCYAVTRSDIEEALTRMERFVKRYSR